MRFISCKNPISDKALKRRSHGTTVVHHYGRSEVRFVRVHGGWLLCENFDGASKVVTSSEVAAECNKAVGCKESWAELH